MDNKSKTAGRIGSRGIEKRAQSARNRWLMILLLMAYDFFATNGSYFLALWMRFDCEIAEIPAKYFITWKRFVPIYTVVCLSVFYALRMYRSVWRFAGYNEFKNILIANLITAIFHAVAINVCYLRDRKSVV